MSDEQEKPSEWKMLWDKMSSGTMDRKKLAKMMVNTERDRRKSGGKVKMWNEQE
jgi:hypothetical protein